MLGPQDDALRGMETWQPPEPLSRPPSAMERERRVRSVDIFLSALKKTKNFD